MKTGDHEHPLVGRIRAWDALIILLRLQVSSPPFISRLFKFSTSFTSYGSCPTFLSPPRISFLFSLIELVDPLTHSLSNPHFTTPDRLF